jgi:integrase
MGALQKITTVREGCFCRFMVSHPGKDVNMKKLELKAPKVIQLPSGSYYTQLMVNGVRHNITKATAEECAAEAIAIKYHAIEAKEQTRAGVKKLEDALREYIERRQGSASPSTLYAYERYAANCFQGMMNANINHTTDEQWQAAIRRESAGKSPKYMSNLWGFISAAIYEATGKRPNVKLPAKEKNTRPFLDPDQINVFVDAIKGESIEIAALLALSSLRRSELKAVKWKDIDFEHNCIHVAGAMVYTGDGMVHKKQNKTAASRRTVPMIPPLRAALEAVEDRSEYVVPYNGSWIYQRINEICEAQGLPKVGVHGLRHSFASLAYHLDIPEKIAMEIGGWSDDGTMRKIYTHLAQKDINNRAHDFTNFFKK